MPSVRWHRLARRLFLSLALLLLTTFALIAWLLRASLPTLNGSLAFPQLTAPVRIDRDALGVPTLNAQNRQDAAFATGFLHAQDRFFQMDLSRRSAAGELAELFGPAVLNYDQAIRRHRLRATAQACLHRIHPEHRALLHAYTSGVNAGLRTLTLRPPEYLLLRSTPSPWRDEDSFLVLEAMFLTLQEPSAEEELARAALRKVLPEPAYRFFVPERSALDAAVDDPNPPEPQIPGPDVFSFRDSQPAGSPAASSLQPETPPAAQRGSAGARSVRFPGQDPAPAATPGSNSWAVDGTISTSGAALVANDMHLGLGVPNTWYRARIIVQPDPNSAPTLDVTGLMLPGTPVVAAGSNGHIAWTFTSAELDTADRVELELSPTDPEQYRTPDGWESFEQITETILVHGAAPHLLRFRATPWGPVEDQPQDSPPTVNAWIAHSPDAVDLRFLEFESVRDLDAALDLAPRCGVPILNLVAGDRNGNIGWTLCGRLPQRIGYSGEFPVSWANGSCRWNGLVPADHYPRLVNPAQRRLWTANNRVSALPSYLEMGPWRTDQGARASQIHVGLTALQRARPADMLAIQLDDRVLFLERWQRLLLSVLDQPAQSNCLTCAELGHLVRTWSGRAATNDLAYRFIRQFRQETHLRILEPLQQRCAAYDPKFRFQLFHTETPVWRILETAPSHLLNPRFTSFEALLVEAAHQVVRTFADTRNQAPETLPWGVHLAIRHPLSLAVPSLGRWLDMPPAVLPGDASDLPRVQAPSFGASERFAVSPGHETEGFLHMPGGQSGHFLSPFYRAGHQAWVDGTPLPFLPGPPLHHLALLPQHGG